jgi:tetratricopeptide (TPR) repeat protein
LRWSSWQRAGPAAALWCLLAVAATAAFEQPDDPSVAALESPPEALTEALHAELIDSLLAWRDASRPDRVDSLAGPAIAAARADGDTLHLLPLLLVRGATRAGFGLARQAESDLREALALAASRNDTLRRMQSIRWLSVAIGRQGRSAEAAELYRELEDLAHAAGDSLHLAWAWVGLAYDHYLQGRTHVAGATYARAAGILERYGELAGAVWAWNGYALALHSAGRYREARAVLGHVLALAVANGDVVNEGVALNSLGRLDLQLGDPGSAVARFTRAAAIHRAHHHHREGLVPCIDIAKARIMQGRYAEAETELDSVLTVCRELGLRDLEILAEGTLVDAWLDQGRAGAAAARCRDVLAGGELPSRLNATELRLRLARALMDRDSLVAATEVLETVQTEGAGAVSLELRTAALLGSVLVDRGEPERADTVLRAGLATALTAGDETQQVVLWTHLGRAETALARPDSALEAYRRAIACWERVRAWPSDPIWREHRGTVAGSLFAQAAAALLTEPARLAEAWSWVQLYKARTLQERMQGPGTAAPVTTPTDLATFRRDVLRPGEVFLDLVEGERVSVLFCITPDSAWTGLLPGRAASAPRLQRLADVVTSPDIDDPGPARQLAAAAVADWPEPALRLAAGAPSVLWSPDGSWHRFPAALLPWTGSLARIPAAGVLAQLRGDRTETPEHEQPADASPVTPAPMESRAPAEPHPLRILAVCGPDPDGSGVLPGAAAETAWLDRRLRNVDEVREPTVAGLDAAGWRAADVLHLAAHTGLDPWQPWNTAVTLARGDGGELRAAEVTELSLAARLAVLPGCTTAGSRLVAGEGLIGLASAFLAAHTPAVLATLWPVDDAVALRVITGFYTGLADGLPAAAALAQARRDCRTDPVGRAPRHWAAFVLVGDGEITVPLERRAPRWPWAAGLGLLAAALYLRSRR